MARDVLRFRWIVLSMLLCCERVTPSPSHLSDPTTLTDPTDLTDTQTHTRSHTGLPDLPDLPDLTESSVEIVEREYREFREHRREKKEREYPETCTLQYRTEWLASPARGVSTTPLLSFSIELNQSSLRIGPRLHSFDVTVLRRADGKEAWSSGDVVAHVPQLGIRVPAGVLRPGTGYKWAANWTDVSGHAVIADWDNAAEFDTGLSEESDWMDAKWLGSGHAEFQFTLPSLPSSVFSIKAFVASPGGALATVDGVSVGTDSVGVAGWFDWTKRIYHRVFDMTSLCQDGNVTVILSSGCGSWCPSTAPTWQHSHRQISTPAGALPLLRALIIIEHNDGTQTTIPSGNDSQVLWKSRIGKVVSSSSWTGSVIDHTLSDTEGWTSPARIVPSETIALDLPKYSPVMSLPPVMNRQSTATASLLAQTEDGRWVFQFSEMVVGIVSLAAESWHAVGPGEIMIEYCEVLDKDNCVRQNGYTKNGTVDRHIVSKLSPSQNLSTQFSWRGFQVVIVTVKGQVHFRGSPEDLVPIWTGVGFDRSADISFEGENSALLSNIHVMVERGMLSNLVTGIPTDCPTREKHGWLGDALDTGGMMMSQFWTPPAYKMFFEQIEAGQLQSGRIPVAVPCHGGVDALSNDLSWSSGYAILIRDFATNFGDWSIPTLHYPKILRWVDFVSHNSTNASCYGDLSAIPKTAHEVGSIAAAANFIIGVQSALDIARAIGKAEDIQKLESTIDNLQTTFHRLYWNDSASTYGPLASTQTLTPVATEALKSNAPLQNYVQRAGDTLIEDVENRNYVLTVGNQGSRRLLIFLSSLSDRGHRVALRIATATTFPSWGFWLANGATTCWESWTTMLVPSQDHYHGSRNHGWLCGGIGQWMHASIAGLAPLQPGFTSARISPKIDTNLGPNRTNFAATTPFGQVNINWLRPDNVMFRDLSVKLELNISLPMSMSANLTLPLLTATSTGIAVWEGTMANQVQILNGSAIAPSLPPGLSSLSIAPIQKDSNLTLHAHLAAGSYNFLVTSFTL